MLYDDLKYGTSFNTEYVSDIGGFIYQHFFYSPFGEALASQHANSGRYDTEFRFNGKEQDPELQGISKTSNYYQTSHTLQSRIPLKRKQGYEQTGLYYYGARYYNPRYSIWMSVDPLAHKYPTLTPYAYVANNPINAVDPDGMRIKPVGERAKEAMNSLLSSYGSENQFARLFNLHGEAYARGVLSSKDHNLSKRGFMKRAKGLGLSKSQRNEAFSLYEAIASSEELQVEVYDAEQPAFTQAISGESGTEIGESRMGINANDGLERAKADIKDNGSANQNLIDDLIRPEGDAGSGPYRPDAVGEDYSFFRGNPRSADNIGVRGTIAIDGTGKSNSQNADIIIRAIQGL